MPESKRKLAAIVFTDIVGFTKLTADDQSKASNLLKQQRELLKPIVESFNGSWVKEIGDGLLLVFDTVTDAVKCSIKIQEKTKEIDDLDLRIGIHQGEILLEENDVIGDDVNIASRIEPFAAIGGIAISNKVHDAIIREKEFETKYLGKPQLKGVGQKVEVYCITSHGLPETDLSKVSAKMEREGFQWNLFSVTGAVLTVIGALFWINISFLGIGIADTADVPSVAILLMENLGNSEDEFWARNFTEDLILHIANAGLIRVSTIRQVQNLNKDDSYQDIGKDLKVKYILTSSIQKINDNFNLRCQLIEASTGISSFGSKYQEKLINAPNIVSNLGDKVLNSLNVITNKTIKTEVSKYNADAYEFYLKGKYKLFNSKNNESIEIARGLFNKAIDLDSTFIEPIMYLGSSYFEQAKYDKALKYFNIAVLKAKESNEKLILSYLYGQISFLYSQIGEIDLGLEYSLLSIDISEKLNNVFRLAGSYENIAGVYVRKSDYVKGLEYYDKALKNYSLLEDQYGISLVNHNSALMLMEYGNFKLAYNRFIEASIKFKEFGLFRYTIALNNVGLINYNLGKYYDSIDSLQKCLKQFGDLENKWGVALSSNIISLSYMGIGDFDKSIYYAQNALKINKETNAKGSSRMYNYLSIADNYFHLGEYDISLKYCKSALDMLEDKQPWAEHFVYIVIANNKMMLGEFNDALKYYSESLKIVDDLKLLPNRKLHILIAKTLADKKVGNNIDQKKNAIVAMIKQVDYLDYKDYYNLYQIFEQDGNNYLVIAYDRIKTISEKLDGEAKSKFLNTPICIDIIENLNKVS